MKAKIMTLVFLIMISVGLLLLWFMQQRQGIQEISRVNAVFLNTTTGGDLLYVDVNSTLFKATPDGSQEELGKVHGEDIQTSPDGTYISSVIDNELVVVREISSLDKVTELPGTVYAWQDNAKIVTILNEGDENYFATGELRLVNVETEDTINIGEAVATKILPTGDNSGVLLAALGDAETTESVLFNYDASSRDISQLLGDVIDIGAHAKAKDAFYFIDNSSGKLSYASGDGSLTETDTIVETDLFTTTEAGNLIYQDKFSQDHGLRLVDIESGESGVINDSDDIGTVIHLLAINDVVYFQNLDGIYSLRKALE